MFRAKLLREAANLVKPVVVSIFFGSAADCAPGGAVLRPPTSPALGTMRAADFRAAPARAAAAPQPADARAAAVAVAAPPSSMLAASARRHVSVAAILAKEKATVMSYGDFMKLGDGGANGVVGEFKAWCDAGPGEQVRRVTTSQEKLPYPVLASRDTTVLYFKEHMLHRKKLLSNGEVSKNAFGATEPIIRSTLDRHAKALTLLFRFQVAQGQLPADAPAPNDGGALTDIKQRLSKSTATTRKKNYLPRGKAT
ncbi:hypothetical protein M885DRAFT_503062, partial [Pelagophyceae sp. CCMP2097]